MVPRGRFEPPSIIEQRSILAPGLAAAIPSLSHSGDIAEAPTSKRKRANSVFQEGHQVLKRVCVVFSVDAYMGLLGFSFYRSCY
jgi:hypothetical protein